MNTVITTTKKKHFSVSSICRYAYLWLVTFLFVSEFPLAMGFTTRRVALVLALVTLLVKKEQTMAVWKLLKIKNVKAFFLLLLGVFLINLIHSLTRIDYSHAITYSEPWYYAYIVLYILVFSIYCAVEFRNQREFVCVLVGVLLFQTLIVVQGLLDPTFRMYIYENFYAGDDRFEDTVEEGTRLMGIGLVGADGSVKFASAALALMAYKLSSGLKNSLFWLGYSLLIIGTLFVGRTGVLIELALVLVLIIYSENKVRNMLIIAFFSCIVVYSLKTLLSSLDGFVGERILDWLTEGFYSGKRSSINEGILQGGLPPFSVDLIFGTGLDTGYKVGGIRYSSDSGLIRNYVANGIVGFILYYMAIFKLLTALKMNAVPSRIRQFFYVCIAIAFFIEYKEPFMMKYIFPWCIMSCMLLYLKDRSLK